MELSIAYQDSYSRGELLLRTILGLFYIAIPHFFILLFLGLWGSVLGFISFWAILFTGSYPQSSFEYQVKLSRWSLRVMARLWNLTDGYPPFGLNNEEDPAQLSIAYPESVSRVSVLLRTLFGAFYVVIPHMLCLYFRFIATAVLQFIAWWIVLFTGSYPQSFHEFNVGTLRWQTRLNLYMRFITQEYPAFSGK
ncbi:MAG: DUF4389 domain-containing protein [Fibrobacterales bacterium]